MTERTEDGFELNERFYPWAVSDGGKDLMLIDEFTKMPVHVFFETIEDSFDRGRTPVVLALIATSMRAKHPDWSVDRIARTVLNLNLGTDIEFSDSDEEGDEDSPPVEGEASTGASSADESSPSPTPPET